MLQRIVGCFFLSLLIYLPCFPVKSAVTYTFSGGRFGDDMLAYCHAKWISYKYQIPLLYKPFAYSDQLRMHELEVPFIEEDIKKYNAVVNISTVYSYSIEPNSGVLYIIPYFPESIIERNRSHFFFNFDVDWDDPFFKTELREAIYPRNQIIVPRTPEGCIGVALHVRIGTGYDIPTFEDFRTLLDNNPGSELKFPPLSYYIQQIKRILDICPDKILYIHLFTDHNNPVELISFFKSSVASDRILFGYRNNNSHDKNVLEDFFGITQFHCLIRPDANFALVASKLGTYQISISPWHCSKVNGEYIVDQICMNGQIIDSV